MLSSHQRQLHLCSRISLNTVICSDWPLSPQDLRVDLRSQSPNDEDMKVDRSATMPPRFEAISQANQWRLVLIKFAAKSTISSWAIQSSNKNGKIEGLNCASWKSSCDRESTQEYLYYLESISSKYVTPQCLPTILELKIRSEFPEFIGILTKSNLVLSTLKIYTWANYIALRIAVFHLSPKFMRKWLF